MPTSKQRQLSLESDFELKLSQQNELPPLLSLEDQNGDTISAITLNDSKDFQVAHPDKEPETF